MRVYVDELFVCIPQGRTKRFGTEWCHLWCEPGDEPALHDIAQKIGLKRSYFQDASLLPHYDLTLKKRQEALETGAIYRSSKEYLLKRFRERRQQPTLSDQ